MAGERELARLIAGMEPTLDREPYVFATVADRETVRALHPRLVFEEREGTTVVVTPEIAAMHGLAHEFRCRCITLTVHSALDAVGFLAHVTTELARHGMPVNAVAGFHHDHLFVPADRADEALAILRHMAAAAGSAGDR